MLRNLNVRSAMKEPVDHILRPALPWRSTEGALTECGYDASKTKTLTRPEYFQRLKDLGQQRAAMLTCMTCANTARQWGTWDDDPRKALGREITWECGWSRDGRGERLKDELTAIAMLVEAHRSEFDSAIAELKGRREWREKKAAMQKPPAASGRRL
jgi:hypothetical protein